MGIFSRKSKQPDFSQMRSMPSQQLQQGQQMNPMMQERMQQSVPDFSRRSEPVSYRPSWLKSRHDPFNTRGFIRVTFVVFVLLWWFTALSPEWLFFLSFGGGLLLEQFD